MSLVRKQKREGEREREREREIEIASNLLAMASNPIEREIERERETVRCNVDCQIVRIAVSSSPELKAHADSRVRIAHVSTLLLTHSCFHKA